MTEQAYLVPLSNFHMFALPNSLKQHSGNVDGSPINFIVGPNVSRLKWN